MEAKDQERMEAKETNHPSTNPLSSRSTNSEEQKDEEGGREQDISAHDGQKSNSEASLCSTPVLSSFASYDMADRRFECEVDEIPDFDYLSLSSRWISRKDVFGSNSSSRRSTLAVTGRREEENITEISHPLWYPLWLAEGIHNAANEAEVFKEECLVLAKWSDEVSDHLRSISRLVESNRNLINCRGLGQVPVNCIASLMLALELLLRCGSDKFTRVRRKINKIDSKDFYKLTFHLEFTKEHVKCLVSICTAIVSNKVPNIELQVGNILFYWLQAQISVLKADDSKHSDRVAVANVLRDLARVNEKNKQLILNEGAVPALLNVLKRPYFESQFTAIPTLVTLASHYESIPTIVFKDFLPVIVDLLSNSSEAIQISRQTLFEELLMIVENVEVDAKLRSDAIQILESWVESTFAPDAGEVITILVRQLNDKNKNLVAEVVQLLMLLNLVEMQNAREIYMTIRNFKGGALFERLVDLEEFQSHLANFFEM